MRERVEGREMEMRERRRRSEGARRVGTMPQIEKNTRNPHFF
jgi:hypothetical protein